MEVREFYPGMGQAVAERTILRKKADGQWETWGDVADRVALGNSLLCKTKEEQKTEYEVLKKHISKATTIMSGRHLQHGDETQPDRNYEIFTNCSSSSTSFLLFYLLMNGSGVGRAYDDEMMLVNWDNAPTVRCVIDENHPDFDYSAHESYRDAKHKYGNGKDVLWHTVEDTREGWAKALEIWENAAFEKIHKDKLLILDFSKIRPKGTPIKGMQNRPSSGPVPLMNAFYKASTLKGGKLPRWVQSMYIDHYFAECVLVGGARRAARMSTKTWRDLSVLDFITVKRPIEYVNKSVDQIAKYRQEIQNNGGFKPQGFLWSSNNSITVDQEFWSLIKLSKKNPKYKSKLAKHARAVFQLSTTAAYGDGTGEPGFINQDKLNFNSEGLNTLKGEYAGSQKYQLCEDTQLYMNRLLRTALKQKYSMITNPCVADDTWIQTDQGPRQVRDLIDKPFKAVVDGKVYSCITGFWKTGDKEVFEVTTNRGYSIKATSHHLFKVELSKKYLGKQGCKCEYAWKEVKDLKEDDKIVLNNHRSYQTWGGEGTFEHGWLIGEMVGDGGHNPEKYPSYVRFWGDNKTEMTNIAINYLKTLNLNIRSDFKGGNGDIHETTKCIAMNELANNLLESGTKNLLPKIETMSSSFYCGFLRGIFDADGTVLKNHEKGCSVRLSQSNISRLEVVQRMLARLGIISTIYKDRHPEGLRKLPDGTGGYKNYFCKATHELVISKDNFNQYASLIGFNEPHKAKALQNEIDKGGIRGGKYNENFTAKVKAIKSVGTKPVYDATVEEIHAFDANGLMAHNCGEIPLAMWGAFCCIGDVVLFHADTLDEAEDAVRATVRALMRTNTLDSVFSKEVTRTNRIGVGLTGIHEFAWKFFGYSFRDLLDEEKSKSFWMALSRFKRAVQDEAEKYAKILGVVVPHTDTTIKPSGTVSKLFGLTEGWHLPSMARYLRWVQFSVNDPLVETYRKLGYPIRNLVKYQNTVIVGFPTSPAITGLGLEGKLVTAAQASPEEQYQWLMLGEKYWIHGVDENGMPLAKDTGSQISYTLKYDPQAITCQEFVKILKKYQSQVKCCSIMPQEQDSSYEYLPEQPVTKAEYEAILANIKATVAEDIDFQHVDCAGGACPVDFKK